MVCLSILTKWIGCSLMFHANKEASIHTRIHTKCQTQQCPKRPWIQSHTAPSIPKSHLSVPFRNNSHPNWYFNFPLHNAFLVHTKVQDGCSTPSILGSVYVFGIAHCLIAAQRPNTTIPIVEVPSWDFSPSLRGRDRNLIITDKALAQVRNAESPLMSCLSLGMPQTRWY